MKIQYCLVPVALLLSGCLGKDNVAFVTDTTIGIDLDAKPVKTSIGYDRFEGVLEPQFEDGRLLPVVSSINSQLGLSAFGNGQSFATGASAVVLSDGVGKSGNYFGNGFHHDKTLLPDELSRADGTSTSNKEKYGPDTIATTTSVDERKQVIFTTLTNFALSVEWDAGGVPTAINLGYKRKEIAFTPFRETLIKGATDKKTVAITIPSLLATANVATDMSNKLKLNVAIGQLFATGASATYLAANDGVRDLMGSLLLKNYSEIQASKTVDPNLSQPTLDQIIATYTPLTPEKKTSSVNAAVGLRLLEASDQVTPPITPDVFRSHLAARAIGPDAQKNLTDLLAKMKAL